MFRNARKALATFGGMKSVVAIAAIGWGINVLSQVVEERKALIAELDMVAAQMTATLQENMRAATVNDPVPFDTAYPDESEENDNG